MTTPTPCVCPLAGHCLTHRRPDDPPEGRPMTARQHQQCRELPGMFAAFQRAKHLAPGCGRKAANASKAVGRAIRAVAAGAKLAADPATVAARKAVCDDCPERGPSNVCRECGCALSAKQRLLTEACPLGRWPAGLPAR